MSKSDSSGSSPGDKKKKQQKKGREDITIEIKTPDRASRRVRALSGGLAEDKRRVIERLDRYFRHLGYPDFHRIIRHYERFLNDVVYKQIRSDEKMMGIDPTFLRQSVELMDVYSRIGWRLNRSVERFSSAVHPLLEYIKEYGRIHDSAVSSATDIGRRLEEATRSVRIPHYDMSGPFNELARGAVAIYGEVRTWTMKTFLDSFLRVSLPVRDVRIDIDALKSLRDRCWVAFDDIPALEAGIDAYKGFLEGVHNADGLVDWKAIVPEETADELKYPVCRIIGEEPSLSVSHEVSTNDDASTEELIAYTQKQITLSSTEKIYKINATIALALSSVAIGYLVAGDTQSAAVYVMGALSHFTGIVNKYYEDE